MSDMVTSMAAFASGQKMAAINAQASVLLLKKAMTNDEQIVSEALEMMGDAAPPPLDADGMDIKV